MSLYSVFGVHETAPDEKDVMYLKDVVRIVSSCRLMCLLLAQSCILGAYYTFNANNSYVLQVAYGWSSTSSAVVMMCAALLAALGAYVVDKLDGPVVSILRVTSGLFLLAGLASMAMAFSKMGAIGYVLGSLLQASVMMAAFSSSSALYLTPLKDCAGIAAACEVFFQDVPPSAMSAAATRALVQQGPKALMLMQATLCVLGGLVVWLALGGSTDEEEAKEDAKAFKEDAKAFKE